MVRRDKNRAFWQPTLKVGLAQKKDGYTENNLISTVKYDGGSVMLWESLNETLHGCVHPRAVAGLLLDLSAGQLFKHVKIHTKRIQ